MKVRGQRGFKLIRPSLKTVRQANARTATELGIRISDEGCLLHETPEADCCFCFPERKSDDGIL